LPDDLVCCILVSKVLRQNMGYDAALQKAWQELKDLTKEKSHSIKFLADKYSIDLDQGRVLSLSCNNNPP